MADTVTKKRTPKTTVVVIDRNNFERYNHQVKWADLVRDAETATPGLRFAYVGIDESLPKREQFNIQGNDKSFANCAVFRELRGGITDGHAGLLAQNW